MSRIGNQPVNIPEGVKVDIKGSEVKIEGPKGKLDVNIPNGIKAESKDNQIIVSRKNDSREMKSLHGLSRSLILNMVIGVTEGYKQNLQIIGVGFRAQVSGSKLTLNVGYSKPFEYQIPSGISVKVEDNTNLTIEGLDKQLVGETTAQIRRIRPPEPYKGKGIRYRDEEITLKEGKTVG